MLGGVFNYIIPVENFEGSPPKNFRSHKHAIFGPILVDFKLLTLTANVSGRHRDVNIRQAVNGIINCDSPPVEQKNGKLWSTNKIVIGAHVDLP